MGVRSASPVPSNPLEVHLGYWLRLVSNGVSGAFARALQERGLSVAEWVALNRIAACGGIVPAALADAMGMTRGAISKVLDKLESKQFVARAPNPDDGRAQSLSLTRSGRRILPGLAAIADGNDGHFFDVLDAKEKAALRALLEKLARIHRITGEPVD